MEASTRLWGMCVVRSSMRCGCLCKKVITCHWIVMLKVLSVLLDLAFLKLFGEANLATMKPYGSSRMKIFGQVDVNLKNTVQLLQTNGGKVTLRDEEPVRITIPVSLGRGKENNPNQKWDEAVIIQKLRNRTFIGGGTTFDRITVPLPPNECTSTTNIVYPEVLL